MALADRAELAVRLTLDDRQFTGGVKRARGALAGLDKATSNTRRALGNTARNLERVAFIAAGAVVGGLIGSVKAAADFESQLNIINTIAHRTPEDLAAIGTGIKDLAARGRGDLADLSAGFYDILSAGITDSEGAFQVLDAASKLAIGGLSTNAEAVDILTTAINAFGQDAGQAGHDADIFAKAIELGKVKADEIAASFANVAPIAATQGIEIEEVAAAYAALTAQGTPAAEVTTQMSRAILDLLSPNAELNALQNKTGKNFAKIAREKGLVVALQEMRDAVGGDEQAFKDLFGRVEGYKFALQTTGPQQKIYNDALRAMADAAGTAEEQFSERAKGLNFQVDLFRTNVKLAGITIGTALLPTLTDLTTKINEVFANRQGDIGAFAKDLGTGFAKFAAGISAKDIDDAFDSLLGIARGVRDFDFSGILAGLRLTGEIAKTTIGVFQGIPPWIQQLLLAGAAVNKVTGGLVTGIGQDVFGAAFNKLFTGSFLGRGATPANPLFVSMVGGVPGVPGAPGTPAPLPGQPGFIGPVQQPSTTGPTGFLQRLGAIITGFTASEMWAEKTKPLFDDLQYEIYEQGAAQTAATATASHNAYVAATTANARMSAIRASVDAARHAFLSTPPPTVNVASTTTVSISGQSVNNAVTTYKTWSSGRGVNRGQTPS